ncbi:MAG: hypothetical protein KY475_26940 [Planctomycetes bacterium]|nr:hypothetical protein [Planctomycetota bacterium]
MAQTHLRVFTGDEEELSLPTAPRPAESDTVQVCLGDVARLLADAVHSDRTWLYDFQDEDITVSADLYEVMLAYRFFRRPSA